MTTERQGLERKADQLYEQYATPLEEEHNAEYVAIAPDGRTIIGPSVREVAQRAKTAFGPGAFLFKVGPRAVWKIR